LHNYCPIPEDLPLEEALPDCYSLASTNEEERKKAVRYTKRTIDTASALAAKAVVLHTGRVETSDATRNLIALYLREGKDTKDFQQLKSTFFAERERKAAPFFDNALRSLEELGRYAQDKSVKLGIENRFYCREIPSFKELSVILNKFKGSCISYWHDTGHARVMESLGIIRENEYLDAYEEDLCGMHIHNVVACRDHKAPQAGEIDFSDLPRYAEKNTLKIIEAHHPASADEIREGKKFLEVLFDGRL
jgi:sugar phosphate isomerase/epimerase